MSQATICDGCGITVTNRKEAVNVRFTWFMAATPTECDFHSHACFLGWLAADPTEERKHYAAGFIRDPRAKKK